MDGIKIGRALEEQQAKEDTGELQRAAADDAIDPNIEGKKVLLFIVGLIGVFVVVFGGLRYYNQLTAAQVVDVDALHAKNLDGKLPANEGYTYQGFSFIYADGLWWSEIRQPDRAVKIPLHFGPREVENVTVTGELSPAFNEGADVYMAIDPHYANKYYSLALGELNSNVASGIRRRPVAACTTNDTICEKRPLLNCSSTQGKPLIELRAGEKAEIKLQDTCILITGKDYELVRAADRLIWQWYGVMK